MKFESNRVELNQIRSKLLSLGIQFELISVCLIFFFFLLCKLLNQRKRFPLPRPAGPTNRLTLHSHADEDDNKEYRRSCSPKPTSQHTLDTGRCAAYSKGIKSPFLFLFNAHVSSYSHLKD